MKQKICTVLFAFCIVLVLGIIGGVEGGEPLTNLIWCIPTAILAWVFAVVGGITDI